MIHQPLRLRFLVLLLLAALAVTACGGAASMAGDPGPAEGTSSGDPATSLTGAGSTFDYPVFSKLFPIYEREHGVRVNYQSIGSGGGIQQFTTGTIDFGATDAPMKPEERKAVQNNVLHFPIALGAVVITYNLPEVKQPLRLDGRTVADIYLGRVKKWNASEIARQNPGVKLPHLDIAVVHRSDSSGTTYIFTSWLASQSSEWKSRVGADKDVSWPAGIGGKGNEGVASQVSQVEGAIGYNEIAYALENKMQYARIRNAEGVYITPDLENVTAAAQNSAKDFPPDLTGSILNTPGKNSYPIASYSWVVIHRDYDSKDAATARALVNLIHWTIHDGQRNLPAGYAKLPKAIVAREDSRLRKVAVNGEPVLGGGK